MPLSEARHAVVVSADANYLDVLRVYLESMDLNYPEHPPIHIIHRGLTPEHQRDLSSTFSDIRYIDIEEQHFPVGPGVLHEPGRHDIPLFYARLLVWTELFDAYDVVVYMDVDTLALGPLDELFETPGFRVVQEAYPGSNRVLYDDSADECRPMLEADGIDPSRLSQAVNAGVFSAGRSVRSRDQLSLFARLIDRYSDYMSWADQSLLSLWTHANGFTSDRTYRFNFQVRLFRKHIFHPEFADARVIHFNGMAKSGRLARTMLVVSRLVRFSFGRRVLTPVFVRSQLLSPGWALRAARRLLRVSP